MVEAYSQLLILSNIVGTNLTFEIDTATNSLRMATRIDFVDQAVNVIGYDPAEHAWLRIREQSGTVFWDTAPDGRTWTPRFSTVSPSWVADPDLQVQLLAHCSPLVTGSGGYAEFDNFNLPPILDDGYRVLIDWNGDGTYDGPHENVTDDVLQRGPVVFEYGRDQARALSPPRVGTLGFTLCNADRIYSPENEASPISEDVSPASPVKVEEIINDILYPLMTGRIDTFEIMSSRRDRSATITALDGLALLRGTRISTELYAAKRTGTLIGIILDTIGWTAPRDLDVGATHVPWWWANDSDAFDLVTQLLRSEGPPSVAYIAPDGTFIFRDRHHRILRPASLTPQAIFASTPTGEACCDEAGFGEGGYGDCEYGG